jgi:cbb3-type cytochrome oxidase subunit 3
MTLSQMVGWFQAHSVIGALAIFGAIAIAAYWPGRRARLQGYAMIPLNDDER